MDLVMLVSALARQKSPKSEYNKQLECQTLADPLIHVGPLSPLPDSCRLFIFLLLLFLFFELFTKFSFSNLGYGHVPNCKCHRQLSRIKPGSAFPAQIMKLGKVVFRSLEELPALAIYRVLYHRGAAKHGFSTAMALLVWWEATQ